MPRLPIQSTCHVRLNSCVGANGARGATLEQAGHVLNVHHMITPAMCYTCAPIIRLRGYVANATVRLLYVSTKASPSAELLAKVEAQNSQAGQRPTDVYRSLIKVWDVNARACACVYTHAMGECVHAFVCVRISLISEALLVTGGLTVVVTEWWVTTCACVCVCACVRACALVYVF